MNSLRPANPLLEGVEPYDPKYLPARAMMSANENPDDVPLQVRQAIDRALAAVPFNRYPDPLANDLRDAVAGMHGLQRDNVLVGNGGDELLFDIALAWGGSGRTTLDAPPTFSVYAANAALVGTQVACVPRNPDTFELDQDALIDRVRAGDVDYLIVCSPNNPTGNLADLGFVEQLLESTDALVVIDEAYGEFCEQTAVPLLARHQNLAILRTFSKAYALAGVRLGYLLANPPVIRELLKVRQPYSVDVLSQTVGLEVVRMREAFEPGIRRLVEQREALQNALAKLPGVTVYPSSANYVLFRLPDAPEAACGPSQVWQALYDAGVLVRDFTRGALTRNCLRVSVGTPEQNKMFLDALEALVKGA